MRLNLHFKVTLTFILFFLLNPTIFTSQTSSLLYATPNIEIYKCTINAPVICDAFYGELSPMQSVDDFLSDNVWIVGAIRKRNDFGFQKIDIGFNAKEEHPMLFNVCHESKGIKIVSQELQLMFEGYWDAWEGNRSLNVSLRNPYLNLLPEYFESCNLTLKYIMPSNHPTVDAVLQIIGKDKNECYYIELKEIKK